MDMIFYRDMYQYTDKNLLKSPGKFHMEKDRLALCRYFLFICLVTISSFALCDDDIYVATEEDQYSEDDESIFDWNFERFAVQLNLASYHSNSSEDYNEFNRGIGIEYHLDNFFLSGGYFWNSLYRHTFYAGVGKEITFGNVNWVGVGALAGAITGYKEGQRPRPAIVPYIFFTKDRYTFKIHYVPEIGDVQDDAFGFALRIKLD